MLSSVSEKGAGGEDGGRDDWELRRAGLDGSWGGEDGGNGDASLWRLEPREAYERMFNAFFQCGLAIPYHG